ncbi:nuclease-related domain-containing protein [Peribacillus sp. JNUCC 23]
MEVQTEISKNQAGFNGKQSLDYHLSFISSTDHLILHNLRILGEKYYFQIDALILTTRFFLIIDAKDYSGTLYFDSTHNQLI